MSLLLDPEKCPKADEAFIAATFSGAPQDDAPALKMN
jgi:hypothetical protein